MPWKSLPFWFAVSLLCNSMLGLWMIFDRQSSATPQFSHFIQDPNQSLATGSAANPDLSSPVTKATASTLQHRQSLSYEGWVALLSQEAAALAANPPRNLSVLAGDSISLWFPADLLPPDQVWLNQGISGETTEGLLRRIDAFEKLEPQNIFVMIGINDLIHGLSSDQVFDNEKQLIEGLKSHHPHSRIILQSILPHSGQQSTWEGRDRLLKIPNTGIKDLNDRLKNLAAEEQIEYLDLWDLFTDNSGNLRPYLTTDGLHLNTNGYLVWSAALQLFMESQPTAAPFNRNLAQQDSSLPL